MGSKKGTTFGGFNAINSKTPAQSQRAHPPECPWGFWMVNLPLKDDLGPLLSTLKTPFVRAAHSPRRKTEFKVSKVRISH